MNDDLNGSSEHMSGTEIRTAGGKGRSLMQRFCARRENGESGQALVEFAYVAPVLLLVTFGMCLFGIAFNKYLTLNNAVEVGGQLLSEERGGATDPCAAATTATENAAPNLGLGNSNFSYTVNGTAETNSCSGVTLVSGTNVTETVTYTLSFSVPFLGSQSFPFSASVEEIVQ